MQLTKFVKTHRLHMSLAFILTLFFLVPFRQYSPQPQTWMVVLDGFYAFMALSLILILTSRLFRSFDLSNLLSLIIFLALSAAASNIYGSGRFVTGDGRPAGYDFICRSTIFFKNGTGYDYPSASTHKVLCGAAHTPSLNANLVRPGFDAPSDATFDLVASYVAHYSYLCIAIYLIMKRAT